MIQQRGHLAMYINLWEQKGPGFPSHGLTPLATAPGWNLGFGQWLRKFRTLLQVANITSHCMGINYMGITWALQTVATIYIYNYITLYNIPRLFDLGKKKKHTGASVHPRRWVLLSPWRTVGRLATGVHVLPHETPGARWRKCAVPVSTNGESQNGWFIMEHPGL